MLNIPKLQAIADALLLEQANKRKYDVRNDFGEYLICPRHTPNGQVDHGMSALGLLVTF
jgi:hypothetical protein